jgi:hypothetical protein
MSEVEDVMQGDCQLDDPERPAEVVVVDGQVVSYAV